MSDWQKLTNKESPSNDRQNVSFKFSKKTAKALAGNTLDDSGTTTTERDFVTSVSKNEFKSSITKEKEKDLVIPLIRKNKWRTNELEANANVDSESKIKEMAIKELLQETAEQNEKWEKRDYAGETEAIPLIMQNKIPEGYETDDKMDVSLRPNESTMEDYERVPIEKYGLAVLRGMGWKEGLPIGANAKICAEPIKVQVRPKGLGLGADTSALKKVQANKNKDEKLALVKGAYVHIIQGSEQGHYGQVLGLDEENARAIIKLSSDKIVTFPEFYIDVVSKKVYDKEKNVINRDSYQKFKNEEAEKERSTSKNEEDSKSRRKRKEESSGDRHKDPTHDRQPKKRRNSQDRSSEKFRSEKRKKLWIRPQLRVRLIDDKYKKGKYFNSKVVVMDVLSPENCSCKTDDNKYLDDVSPSMLETVIPRTEPGYVMIVQGKHSGELCTILKRDKSKCIATVQLLSDRDQALKVDYDAICEYVGDVSQFD